MLTISAGRARTNSELFHPAMQFADRCDGPGPNTETLNPGQHYIAKRPVVAHVIDHRYPIIAIYPT
jgi:hypothetical protein